MRDDDIVGWFSLENGQHIPLREGESKEQATKKFLSKSKVSEYKKKKQSNNKIDEGNRKITKLVKKGNTYIPIRKGENEKERIKEFKKSNSPETMSKIKRAQRDEQMEQSGVRIHLGEKGERGVAEAQKRKGTVVDYEKRVSRAEMMKFTAENKDLIDKWANEYNTNENFRKSVNAKIMNHEGLSTKEYFGFLGSKPREGDLILSGGKHGEDVIVGKNSKLEQIPDSYYDKDKYYVGKKVDDFKAKKQSNNKVDNEYHFAGEELYSDDPKRYDDIIKSNEARKEKFKADTNFKKEKHIGWGDYNKDGVPVYNNDIDYKGDFGWANLKSLSDDDLTKALNIQSQEYHKANAESVGDGRTRNGRMDRIFKNAKVGKYEQGMKKINEEMQKRDMPRYNIYDKKNPNNILVSSPTKEMADRQIQDMYKTDMALQKEYGWKELPKYDYRVGKVDENLNEIKETIKKYKKRKGK